MSNKSAKRAEAREIEKCAISDFCDVNRYEMNFINPYQIRIDDKVDVYPTSKKFCVMHWASLTGRPLWGTYQSIKDIKVYLV